MKCPHCEEEIPGSPCPGCGESVFDDDANYCMACGISLKESVPPVSRDESFLDDEADIDFDDRELCPDGTCTGIMVDGRCTECGKAQGDGNTPKAEAEEAVTEEQTGEAETDEPAKEKDV
jgi:hypothetical protein